jgi:hypothetical protein
MKLVLAGTVVLLGACNSNSSDKASSAATAKQELPVPAEGLDKGSVVSDASPPPPPVAAKQELPLRTDGLYMTEIDTESDTRY